MNLHTVFHNGDSNLHSITSVAGPFPLLPLPTFVVLTLWAIRRCKGYGVKSNNSFDLHFPGN